MNIWYNNGNMEDNVLWENKYLMDYVTRYFLFRRKEVSRNEFRKQIEVSATVLIKLFEPIIHIIEKSSHIKLHFLTDYITSAFPFLSIFIDNDIIKKMIDEDRFELVVNPILYVRKKLLSDAMRVDFVEYAEENLDFQGAEFHVISPKFQTARYSFESWVNKTEHNETVSDIIRHLC